MALRTIQFPILSATNDDEETAAETVPEEILEQFMSGAPAKTVLRWKIVSTSWRRMLDNPDFARIHYSRAPFCPLLVFGRKSVYKSSRIMHLVEGQNASDLDPRIKKSNLISRIDFDTRLAAGPFKFGHRFEIRNVNAISCEGLVCWILHDHPDGDYIFICNPITGEYVSLSPLPMDDDYAYIFIGIGFCRTTKKFELLRMAARIDDDDDDEDDGGVVGGGHLDWWPEVRTVGDKCWRRVGDESFPIYLLQTIRQVVYVNGVIYWSYDEDADSVLCYFDFDSALFVVIELPETKFLIVETNRSDSKKTMHLGVLGDSLCVSIVSPVDGHVELWIMENISEVKWKKLYDVETKTTYLEHSGILWPRGQYKVVKYLQCGEILMHDWRGKFIVYDPITKEERHFCVLRDSCFEDLRKDGFDDLQVVAHVPCLVKLKETLNIVDDEGAKVMKKRSLVNSAG